MRNLVLLINNYWKQQTDNNKTLILFYYWLKTVTSCSRFWINLTNLNESKALITVISEFFFCEGFSLGHVIITKIISHTNKKTACNTDKNHSSAANSKLKRGIMSVYLTYLCINLIGFYMFWLSLVSWVNFTSPKAVYAKTLLFITISWRKHCHKPDCPV